MTGRRPGTAGAKRYSTGGEVRRVASPELSAGILGSRPDGAGDHADGEYEVSGDDEGAAAAVDSSAGEGQGDGGGGEDPVPDGNPECASEAGAGDDDGGDEQSGEDVEGVAVERFAQGGGGPAAAGEEDGGDGVGQAGDCGQDDRAGDDARHGIAGAECRCAAFHGGAGRDDDGKREDGDGGISRAALFGADSVGQFLFFLGDCLGEPGPQPWGSGRAERPEGCTADTYT